MSPNIPSKICQKLAEWYFAPADFLVKRLCGGGHQGLPLLIILMLVIPPMFYLSILAMIIFIIGYLMGAA